MSNKFWHMYVDTVKESYQTYKGCIVDFIDTFNTHTHWYERFALLMTVPVLLCGFGVFIIFYLIFLPFVWVIYKIYSYLNASSELSIVQSFDYSLILELICKILRENAVALDLQAPKTSADILPTQHSVIYNENGFGCYRFIAGYSGDISTLDLQAIQKAMNLKIGQHLQSHFYNYTFRYNELPVIYVYRIEESLYHPDCLDIYVMQIDSEEKYSYLHHLNRSNNMQSGTTNLTDEDF